MSTMEGLPCNLLVTYDTQHREAALRNLNGVLASLGAAPRLREPEPPGVFLADVPGDPKLVVRAVRGVASTEPMRLGHTHHWRPVEVWTSSDIPSMQRAVEDLARRIGPGDTWRLTAQIHGDAPYHTSDLVGPLTEPVRGGIPRMRGAAKELRVDVLGDHAALALLERGEELSVDRERRALLEAPPEA